MRNYPIKVLVRNHRIKSKDIVKQLQVGLELLPSEVKSMRARSCDLSAAFIAHTENELFLHQCFVPVWRNGILGTHDPYRNRKILAKRREIEAWNVSDPELTVVRTDQELIWKASQVSFYS